MDHQSTGTQTEKKGAKKVYDAATQTKDDNEGIVITEATTWSGKFPCVLKHANKTKTGGLKVSYILEGSTYCSSYTKYCFQKYCNVYTLSLQSI